MLGETLPSITKDMDTYTYRLPLGVCAGIAPFNFPAMIPLWMFPMGMVCGNTYLLKPSERVPTCAMLLAKMLQDAGAPDGTLNIIHGQHDGKSWSLFFSAGVSQNLPEPYPKCRYKAVYMIKLQWIQKVFNSPLDNIVWHTESQAPTLCSKAPNAGKVF